MRSFSVNLEVVTHGRRKQVVEPDACVDIELPNSASREELVSSVRPAIEQVIGEIAERYPDADDVTIGA